MEVIRLKLTTYIHFSIGLIVFSLTSCCFYAHFSGKVKNITDQIYRQRHLVGVGPSNVWKLKFDKFFISFLIRFLIRFFSTSIRRCFFPRSTRKPDQLHKSKRKCGGILAQLYRNEHRASHHHSHFHSANSW